MILLHSRTKRTSWNSEYISKTERYIVEKVVPMYFTVGSKGSWINKHLRGLLWSHTARTFVEDIKYRTIISIDQSWKTSVLHVYLDINGTEDALYYQYVISTGELQYMKTQEEERVEREEIKRVELLELERLREINRHHLAALEQQRQVRRDWILEHVIKNEMYSAARAASEFSVAHGTITNDIKMIGRQFNIPKWVGKDWKDILEYLRDPIGRTSKYEHCIKEYLNQIEQEAIYKKQCDFIEVMVEEIDGHSLLSDGCYRTPKRRRAE